MKNLRSSIASLFIVALVSACPPTGPGPGTQNGLPDFSVGVKVRGLGTGTIDSSAGPLKFDFLSYTQTVHGGVTATLTAKPDTDSTFIGWTGSCSGIGTCDVRGVTATEPLEARFGLPGSWNQRFTTGESGVLGLVMGADGSITALVADHAAGAAGGMLTHYAANGTLNWSTPLPGIVGTSGDMLVTDSGGNFYFSAAFTGTADFGGGPVTSAGSTDLVLASYSPTGAFRWARTYGDTGAETATGLSIDDAGDLLVTGSSPGMKLDLNSTSGGPFVLYCSPSGGAVSCSPVGVQNDQYGQPHARILPNGTWVGAVMGFDGYQVGYSFVLHEKASWNDVWARFIPLGSQYAQGADSIDSVAVDADSNLYFVGTVADGTDFGTGAVPNAVGYRHLYALSLDGTGATRWAKVFVAEDSNNLPAPSLKLDSAGGLHVAGWLSSSSIQGFGLRTPPYALGGAAFLLQLASDGTGTRVDYFPDAKGAAVAVAPDGSEAFAGTFSTTVDLGDAVHTEPHGSNAFLVRLPARH